MSRINNYASVFSCEKSAQLAHNSHGKAHCITSHPSGLFRRRRRLKKRRTGRRGPAAAAGGVASSAMRGKIKHTHRMRASGPRSVGRRMALKIYGLITRLGMTRIREQQQKKKEEEETFLAFCCCCSGAFKGFLRTLLHSLGIII